MVAGPPDARTLNQPSRGLALHGCDAASASKFSHSSGTPAWARASRAAGLTRSQAPETHSQSSTVAVEEVVLHERADRLVEHEDRLDLGVECLGRLPVEVVGEDRPA